MHKIPVHAQDSCACTTLLVHAQLSCACTGGARAQGQDPKRACMHENLVHAQES